MGYYYFDGSAWVGLKNNTSTSSDATRFLGGSVYTRFSNATAGNPQLDGARVIGGSNGNTYVMGTENFTSTKGGITTLKGNGYKISNPSMGVFDIELDTPMTEIYGISSNILDSYRAHSYPIMHEYGQLLNFQDNTQIAFISNKIIRIKTGDQYGTLSNRSFTFLIIGK
ncbi:hypothetical protein [Chryseobacterium sp. M5A1_1a]